MDDAVTQQARVAKAVEALVDVTEARSEHLGLLARAWLKALR
jgi:hypothetical protein